MGQAKIIGQTGEAIARAYLEQQGYTFITANWRCKAGELDLLMWAPDKKTKKIIPLLFGSFGGNSDSLGSRASKTLVVIEVRTRSATKYASAEETITYHKQQKIIRATQWYQQSVNFWGDVQFDVVAINTSNTPPQVTHIPQAFTA